MNESARLERGYRRLLACYPRAFRRENGEEILAVLLACAQEGQRRPGLAASADLIKGAIRMRLRLRPAPRQPRAARAAIWLVLACAAAEVAVLITEIATAASVQSAVERGNPGLPGVRQAVGINLDIDYASALIGIAWLLMVARSLNRGRGRARIAFAADFVLITLSMIIGVGQGSMAYAPADMIAGTVVWLIALAASVLLFTSASSRYYYSGPRSVTPWRGTFGTM